MRPRFSLRLFLIAFTLLAILFGAAAHFVYRVKDQVRRHRQAVDKLRAVGFDIEEFYSQGYPETPTSMVAFARKWIDSQCYQQTGWAHLERKLPPEEAITVLRVLRDIYRVRSLRMHFEILTLECVNLLRAHKDLIDLEISYDRADKNVSQMLLTTTELETLAIYGPLVDDDAQVIGNLPMLRWFRADFSGLSVTGAKYLMSCHRLEYVLPHTGQVKAGVLAALVKNPAVTNLALEEMRLTEDSLKGLEDAPSLEDVSIWKCSVPVSLIDSLSKAPKLEHIRYFAEEGAAQLDFRGLKDCSRLKGLEYHFSRLDEKTFGGMNPPRSLEYFGFDGDVGDATIFAFLTAHPLCKVYVHIAQGNGVPIKTRSFKLEGGNLKVEEETR